MASGERQAHASHRVPQDPLGFGRRSPVNLERARNDLPKRLYEASGPHLLSFDGPRTGPVTGATVHLSTLQRMCLRELQAELVDVVTQIFRDKRATKQKMEDARDLLQKFTSCLRDYDYMTEQEAEARRNDQPDPFNISTQNELGQYLLRPLIDQQLAERPLEQQLWPPVDQGELQKGKNILPLKARGAANNAARLRLMVTSLVTGIIAGLGLILPMLIMVLSGGLATTLIISSAATILFAGGLAFFTDMRPEGVMGAVAAYAAVYVVFVGAST